MTKFKMIPRFLQWRFLRVRCSTDSGVSYFSSVPSVKWRETVSNWNVATTIQTVLLILYLLSPTGNLTYYKVYRLKLLHGDYTGFVCFIWILERTANFVLLNIKNWVLNPRWRVFTARYVRSAYITQIRAVCGRLSFYSTVKSTQY
jgi:hypothetical protein